MRNLAVAVLLLAGAGNLQAQEFAIAGAGALPCRTVLNPTDADVVVIRAWSEGFLSGMNSQRYVLQKKEVVLLPSAAVIGRDLVAYCQTNPSKQVLHGIVRIWQRLDNAAP